MRAIPAAVRQLQATIELLKVSSCSVRQGDALAQLAGLAPASIDLMFLDPPFNAGWLTKLQSPVTRALSVFRLSTGLRLWLDAFIRYADLKNKELFRKDV